MADVNWIQNIPFFSIFLAMFCAILSALVRSGRTAQTIHMLMAWMTAILSAVLLGHLVQTGESFSFQMGHFPAPWGNELRAGPLEALMALVFSVVMLLTSTGGQEFVFQDVVPEKQRFYYVMLHALFGAMLALVYTNDIFTAYVFIEILTIASCALILAKGTAQAMVGTTHYLVISLLGSGTILLGISILYSITGHLLFPQLKEAVVQLAAQGQYSFVLLVAAGLLFLGLAIKSALFPFHSMLPGAYQAAIPTASGILSGLVLKSYIVLSIKWIYSVFSIEVMLQIKIMDILFVFGLLGMVMGSLYAMRENRMKRMLAYSSVAQIGYIYMGIGMGSRIGMVAACFHILAHAVTKSMLFLCCGQMVKDSGGKEQIFYLRGIAHKNPLAGIGFTVGALSMIGIPMLVGFISKLYFATASVYAPGKMAAVMIVLGISMVLNAMYFLPSVIAIWTPVRTTEGRKERSWCTPAFGVCMLLFIGLQIALGVCYQPFIRVIEMGIGLLQ